ncbi:MAG: hypothetical protein ACOCV1_04605 [Bacillota bacterium]
MLVKVNNEDHAVKSVQGYCKWISVKQNEVNNQKWESLNIKLTQDDLSIILSLNFESSFAQSFLRKAKNIDFQKPIRVKAGKFTDSESKTIYWLNVEQDGKKVQNYFTKDSKEQLPEATKVMFKGKEQWDFSAVHEFYKKMIVDEIQQKLGDNLDEHSLPDFNVDDFNDNISVD